MGSFSSGKVGEREREKERERGGEQSPIVGSRFAFGRVSLLFRNYNRPRNVTKCTTPFFFIIIIIIIIIMFLKG